jgi:hypothetical protein
MNVGLAAVAGQVVYVQQDAEGVLGLSQLSFEQRN